MPRSIWKGPLTINNSSLRNITVTPELLNKPIEVHNGKQLITITPLIKNLGEKIGKLVPSKIFISHKKKVVKQTKSKKN
jgi:ribosomal protein S19